MPLMAHASHAGVISPAFLDARKKYVGGHERKQELEQEVSKLKKMLDDEEKVHQVLERALLPCAKGSIRHIPSFLPKKAKELLAELVMVEEEIARLEGEISKIQQGINDEQEARAREMIEVKQPENTTASLTTLPNRHSLLSNQTLRCNSFSEKVTMETKPMFFINQAIKGDYTMHGFSRRAKETVDKKDNQKVVGLNERIPRKIGVIDSVSSPKLPPKSPTQNLQKQSSEILINLLQDASINPTTKSNQNWQPNKLSERIVKCLICVFQRLLRTTRTLELEKSGNLSRSFHSSLLSTSLRMDGTLNSKATQATQKDMSQKDPYGIFETEDSLLRDIGPYKNLVRFTTNSLDLKGISTSLPLLKKLRELLSSLQGLDLWSLNRQQKMAFWINMHNTCIMHGFLEHGLPSNPEKLVALRNKAVLNIGGNKLNAVAIEHFILRQPSNTKETTLKGEKDETEDPNNRNMYALEYPEPNIAFALCCGARSSPAIRIYTAEGITAELEKAKLEYLQASIVVTAARKLMIPKLLESNMYEFAEGLDSLVEWICNQLPTSGTLRKSIVECLKARSNRKTSDIVDVIPYDSEFQYLLPK